jgi:23S rRNA pseudouridine2457 synthase
VPYSQCTRTREKIGSTRPLTQRRYVLFHKPYGVLSQFTPGQSSVASEAGHRTLADFIDVPDVYPVGRLDHDSEGLLFLTNDGDLQHRLSDPAFAHPRTYWVQVEGTITSEALRSLENGVVIQGYRTRPANARPLFDPAIPPRDPPIRYRAQIPTSWFQLTLTEGRNRQVRRMTAAVGFPTLRLVRVAIGSLTIQDLASGSWRNATEDELKSLRSFSPQNKADVFERRRSSSTASARRP